MPRYTRAYVPSGSFFFTVALLERHRSLLVDHVDLLRAAFARVRDDRPFAIDAIVVLPNHLHCIWTLPPDDADFSTRWRLIKSHFVRALPYQSERLSQRRVAKKERGIWQRRFWEHLIRDERDFRNHVDYIHFNPVKHGLVTRAADWPYSSFHHSVARGDLDADWGAGTEVSEMVRE